MYLIYNKYIYIYININIYIYIYNYNIYIYTIFKNYLIVGFTYSLFNTADPTKIIIMGNHNLIMNV